MPTAKQLVMAARSTGKTSAVAAFTQATKEAKVYEDYKKYSRGGGGGGSIESPTQVSPIPVQETPTTTAPTPPKPKETGPKIVERGGRYYQEDRGHLRSLTNREAAQATGKPIGEIIRLRNRPPGTGEGTPPTAQDIYAQKERAVMREKGWTQTSGGWTKEFNLGKAGDVVEYARSQKERGAVAAYGKVYQQYPELKDYNLPGKERRYLSEPISPYNPDYVPKGKTGDTFPSLITGAKPSGKQGVYILEGLSLSPGIKADYSSGIFRKDTFYGTRRISTKESSQITTTPNFKQATTKPEMKSGYILPAERQPTSQRLLLQAETSTGIKRQGLTIASVASYGAELAIISPAKAVLSPKKTFTSLPEIVYSSSVGLGKSALYRAREGSPLLIPEAVLIGTTAKSLGARSPGSPKLFMNEKATSPSLTGEDIRIMRTRSEGSPIIRTEAKGTIIAEVPGRLGKKTTIVSEVSYEGRAVSTSKQGVLTERGLIRGTITPIKKTISVFGINIRKSKVQAGQEFVGVTETRMSGQNVATAQRIRTESTEVLSLGRGKTGTTGTSVTGTSIKLPRSSLGDVYANARKGTPSSISRSLSTRAGRVESPEGTWTTDAYRQFGISANQRIANRIAREGYYARRSEAVSPKVTTAKPSTIQTTETISSSPIKVLGLEELAKSTITEAKPLNAFKRTKAAETIKISALLASRTKTKQAQESMLDLTSIQTQKAEQLSGLRMSQKSLTKQRQRTENASMQGLMPRSMQRTESLLDMDQLTQARTKTSLRLSSESVLEQVQSPSPIPGGETGPGLFFRLPEYEPLTRKGKKGSGRTYSFQPGYSASITANVLNIRGRMPTGRQLTSGLGIRPMG